MRRFRSFNHSACKTALNLLGAIYLRLMEVVVERELQQSNFEWTIEASVVLAVFGIAVRTDTAELSDMRIAGLRK